MATRPAAHGRHDALWSRPIAWLWAKKAWIAAAVGAIFLATTFYVLWAIKDLPDPSQNVLAAGDVMVLDRNGRLIEDWSPAGHYHITMTLQQMGRYEPKAVLAAEDRNFYNHGAVDPWSIARAAWVDVTSGGATQGGSTITQQLVKIQLLTPQKSLTRKLQEVVLAVALEQRYSKDQILEMYLNAVFYGNSAAGSAAAAQIYFHTKTADLTLGEAAMLAGLVRGPTYYSPLFDWNRSKARQKEVLDAMVRDGKVTQAEADTAYAEDLRPPAHMFLPTNKVVAPGFVSYVTSQLIKKYGSEMTYGGALRVQTTLNLQLQQIGQSAISGTQSSISWRRVQQGALVAIDPTSGAIIAMVSSAVQNANGGQYNLAVWPPRNPGSSMKIYTYTTAIASGRYTMTTPIADTPIAYMDGSSWWRPRNYDGRYHGTLQLQQCMGNSLNIPAVKVELGVGTQSVVNTARAMGAPPWTQHADGSYTNDDPLNSYGPSLTLGGYGETPLQMATGASVLAAQGVLHQPFAIQSIQQVGKTIYTHEDSSKQVLDPRVAYIMGQIMSNDRNHALIFGMGTILNVRGYQVAVKTGTSDSFADAWTVGFTPRIAVAVWMGNPDWRIKMTQGSDSFYVAVPAWHAFLASALPVLGPNVWYDTPAGLVNVRGNWYLPGTQPRR